MIFCPFAQLVTTFFFSAWDKSRVKWDNSRNSTQKMRTLINFFQHLGFVHCPIREHCHAFPNCMDSLVERIVAKKSVANSGRPSSWAKANQGLDSNHLNLVVLGSDNLTGTLERQVKSLCNSDDEFLHQDEIFSLDYRCVSGDVSLPENAFRTQDFLPHGKTYFRF